MLGHKVCLVAENGDCMLISLYLSQKCPHSLFSLYDCPLDSAAELVEVVVVEGKYCNHSSSSNSGHRGTNCTFYFCVIIIVVVMQCFNSNCSSVGVLLVKVVHIVGVLELLVLCKNIICYLIVLY